MTLSSLRSTHPMWPCPRIPRVTLMSRPSTSNHRPRGRWTGAGGNRSAALTPFGRRSASCSLLSPAQTNVLLACRSLASSDEFAASGSGGRPNFATSVQQGKKEETQKERKGQNRSRGRKKKRRENRAQKKDRAESLRCTGSCFSWPGDPKEKNGESLGRCLRFTQQSTR